ncbi:MAG: calcium/sodium antiporter [Candidatus Gracilibacteria bacterium]|nr:calcium/sodium antiporter [Candidatus Gracilibacteria bacterium]MDQ7023341.1 calcium/sodium antiporter [Candidatus Gracilibacteria bacterium]
MDYIFIIAGFALLIKGADYMVDGASSLAKTFGVSNLVIGLTIVAFGTSAPELVASMMSAFSGNSDLAISNVIGSNISNLLLILGITALVYPIKTPSNTFYKEIPFMLASTILFVLLVVFEPNQEITRPDAWILIMFFSIFLYYIFKQATKPKTILGIHKKEKVEEEVEDLVEKMPKWKSISFTIGGLVGLVIGGKLIVDGAVSIAQSYNIPNSFIGVTIIAIGTSLPELASSVIAALKKNTDMAIGGIIGSNIFNSLWILGATGTIMPLQAYSGVERDAYFNIFVVILIIVLLSISKNKFEINKKGGILLILLYFSYIGYLIFDLLK